MIQLERKSPKEPIVETDSEKIARLEEESFELMMATTEMYENQSEENLALMLAITELYELTMEV